MGNEQSLQPGIPHRRTASQVIAQPVHTQAVQPQPVQQHVRQQQPFHPPDPFVFFGLTFESTPQQAKRAYYRKAQEYHPDSGGDPRVFGWIHQAYIQVLHQLEEQKNRVDEHAERRKEYQGLKKQQEERSAADDALRIAYQEQEPKQKQKTKQKLTYEAPVAEGPTPKFQVERFNEVFEKTRQSNPMDRGYSAEELDQEMNQYDNTVHERLQNATKDQFMSAFETQKQSWQNIRSKQENQRQSNLAVYRGPEALVSSSLISNVQELGGDTPDDFTAASGALQYTDYKGAYTKYHNLENPDVDLSNRPQSIDAYQAERSNIRFTKTAEEEAHEAAYKAWEEEQEKERIQRLLEQDRIAMLQHDKAKKFYLREGKSRK